MIWKDLNNWEGIRPDSVPVFIYQDYTDENGVPHHDPISPSTVVTKEDGTPGASVWKIKVEDLPAAKTTEGAGGEKQVVYYYTYSVEQVEVSEYESDIAHDDPVSNGVKSFSWKITYRHNFELPLSGR